MSTLYIDRQGTTLKADSHVLHISTPDGTADRRLPLKYLDRVVLRTDTQLSSKVLCALSQNQVSLLALSGRAGQHIAQLTGAPHNDARRRWQQILTFSQASACAGMAKAIVMAKVRRQKNTLSQMLKQRADLRHPLQKGINRLTDIQETLKDTPATSSQNLETIRGLEGAAAARYFEAYFSAFAPALGATGRNRRPPRDPVNAVLSLSYTLLYSEASVACWSAGLDPALGFLHTLSHGRAALACDLMEPFRPLIDIWVWEIFRQGLLRKEHFGHEVHGACLLGKTGREHFYMAWEQQVTTWRPLLQRYTRHLASSLLAKEEFQVTWAHLQGGENDEE